MGKSKAIIKNPLPTQPKMRARKRSSHTIKLPTKDNPLSVGKQLARAINPSKNARSITGQAQKIKERDAEIYLPPPPPKHPEDLDFVSILLLPGQNSDYKSLVNSIKVGGMPFVLFADRIINTEDEVTIIKSADASDALRVLFLSAKVPYVVIMRTPIVTKQWLYNSIKKLINTKKSTILYNRGGKLSIDESTLILSRSNFIKSGTFFDWGWTWMSGLEVEK